MNRQRHNSRTGFVSLEVLIALAITGIVLTSMVRFTVLFMRSKAAVEHRHLARDGDWRLRSVLRMSLESLILLPGPKGPMQTLNGQANGMELFSVGPRALGLNGPTRLQVKASHETSAVEIWLFWKNPATGGMEKDILTTEITSVAFAYLGADGNGLWVNEWTGQPVLPAAIRVELESPARGRSTFVLPIRVQVPVACVAEPRSAQCLPVAW